jgi:hypothetical protein
LALLVLLLGAAAPAWAHGGAIDEAIDALATVPVYVEPGADPTLTDAQAKRLAGRIEASGRPIYVAVIDEQDDPAHEVVHEIVGGVGRDGTYVVVAGGDVGVHATEFDHAVSERLQADANAKPKDDLAGTLNALVDDVEREAAPAAEDDESTPWVWIVVALVAVGVVAAGATLWALRRGRRPPGPTDVAPEPPA